MTNSCARSVVGLLVAALAGGGVVALASDAAAVSVDVTCVGTERVTYQPGLRVAPQAVHSAVSGTLVQCSSSDPSIESVMYNEQLSATLSCVTLFAEDSGTRVFHWNGDRSSTFAFDRAITDAGGQTTVTLTGTIVKGAFVGDTVVEKVVFETPSTPECQISPGLTTLGTGQVDLTITKA